MFARLGGAVLRFRLALVVSWLVAALAAVTLVPPLASVTSSGDAGFLPLDSPSRAAAARLAARFPDAASGASATVVLSRPGGLTEADRALAAAVAARLRSPEVPAALRDLLVSVETASDVPELAAQFRSPDGVVELLSVRLSGDAFGAEAHGAVDVLRDEIRALLPADPPAVAVTGTAAISRDYLGAVVAGTDRTTLVTVVLVVTILLLIYRAPVAALVPLLTIGAAFAVSRAVLSLLAMAGWQIPSLLDSFIVVLVFGVGTDYAIFLISRHREESARHRPLRATLGTIVRIGAVITASAATVIVALSSMAVASFGMIQTIGPALAVTVAVTLLAGLTLTPPLVSLAGRWLTWPRHPAQAHASTAGADRMWDRLARFVTRRPGLVSAVIIAVLAVPLLALPGLRPSFDALAELPADTEARRGFDEVAAHVDRGALLPVTVLVEAAPGSDLSSPAGLAAIAAMTDRLLGVDGVRAVRSLVAPVGDGVIPDGLRPSVTLASVADQLEQAAGVGPGALAALEDPATLEGIDGAIAYLDELAAAFPELAAEGPLADARTDAALLRSTLAAYQAAEPGSPERSAALATLLAVGPRLPDVLRAAADALAARPDDLFLPASATDDPTMAWLVARHLSPDREAARLSVVTADEPYASGAFAAVRAVSGVLDRVVSAGGSEGDADLASSIRLVAASVSGPTAESADVQAAIGEDMRRVAVITVLGIFVVLALLLRSLVAPIYLVATVLLSYGTTLGLSTILFQDVLGHPGVGYFIPLIVFVLLVALGSDYNIFLMSRVREEWERVELRAAITRASARTGTVITSAGIILAGTFLALVAAPLQILIQVGLAVALGVLIDTFIVRSILIPALTALIGERAWWPSGGRSRTAVAQPAVAPSTSE